MQNCSEQKKEKFTQKLSQRIFSLGIRIKGKYINNIDT